tara:strand:- start:20 stop:235 length:216 start_codon:yes stop_codon:yes gene_type:complete
MKFSDGVEIDTSGKLRCIRKSDGLYVVGHGMCVPVEDHIEALKIINEILSEVLVYQPGNTPRRPVDDLEDK